MLSSSHGRVARLTTRDSLILPQFAQSFVSDMIRFAETKPEAAEALSASVDTAVRLGYGFGVDNGPADKPSKPFVYQDGIAVIPIHGSLINRFNYSWGFATGYQYIQRMIAAIKADLASDGGDVKLVAWDVDCHGGEAAGCFETGEMMRELSALVPTIAVIDSVAASGGLALPVTARKVVAIPSAQIGSIGVYRLHVDMSKAADIAGFKFTFVKAGDHKVDGNPWEPLGDDVKADWQQAVNKTWDTFINFVAENRNLTADQVRATQAKVYPADEALALGLIDGIDTPANAVSEFFAEACNDSGDGSETDGEDEMTKEVGSGAAAAPVAVAAIDQAAVNAAISAGIAAHMTAQRNRASEIRASEFASANPSLANHLIDNTDMAPADAIATLKAAGPAKVEGKPAGEQQQEQQGGQQQAGPVDTTNHLVEAMGRTKQPNVSAGAESGGGSGENGQRTDAEVSNGLLADYQAATGRKLPTAK